MLHTKFPVHPVLRYYWAADMRLDACCAAYMPILAHQSLKRSTMFRPRLEPRVVHLERLPTSHAVGHLAGRRAIFQPVRGINVQNLKSVGAVVRLNIKRVLGSGTRYGSVRDAGIWTRVFGSCLALILEMVSLGACCSSLLDLLSSPFASNNHDELL